MKYVSFALCMVIGFLAWLGRSFCKAFHNDLVQVWDVIEELRVDVTRLKVEKEVNKHEHQ